MRHELAFDITNFTIVHLAIANPAAATNFTSAVTAGVIRQLVGLRFTLTTDATAPSRRASVVFNNGAVNTLRVMASNAITASLTWDINFAIAQQNASLAAGDNVITAPLCDMHYLADGYTFSSQILNMGVADALTDIIATYKQWIIPT